MKFKAGLVSISFRDKTPEQIVKAVKDAGLEAIEWGSDVHATPDKAEAVATLCKKEGVSVCSYGSYFRLGVNSISELEQYIAAAKTLGTDIIRIWGYNKGYADMTKAEREFVISEGKKAADVAKNSGVTLCLECHNKTYTDCIEGALEIMSAVDSDSFQMYWQPNQFKSEQYNIEFAKALADKVKVVHAFNWEGKEKYPLCDAIEIWKKYLAFFKEGTPVLLEFMPDGRIESLETEAKALKEICL